MVAAMRKLTLVLAAGLLASACGGSGTSETSQAVTEAPSTSAVESTVPDSTDTSAAEAPPSSEAPASSDTPAAPSFDGPPAPEFDLALADGSTFSLAGEQKPTYMVFWAEW